MSRVNRAKLTPKHQEALQMFANHVPAGAEKDANSFTIPTQEKEVEQTIATEPLTDDTPSANEPPADDTPSVNESSSIEPQDEQDSDWIDSLTLPTPSTEQPSKGDEPPHAEVPSTTQDVNETDDEYIARMREEFKSMEHLDPEIADEIFDKAISPFVTHQTEKTRAEMQALRNEMAQVQQATNTLNEQQREQRYNAINAPIFAKHPKAGIILKSKEFADFVDTQVADPYAQETQMQRLSRAYEAGDSEYIIKAIDSFVESRGKPKPPVNADGNGTATGSTQKKPQRMTETDFLKQRRAIIANPRKYPQGALRKLEVDFFSQQ